MSLILEALRKSEAERRRGQAPSLSAELPPLALQRHIRIPRWIWIAMATALAVLAVWWLPGPRPPTVAGPSSDSVSKTQAGTATARSDAMPSTRSIDEAFPRVERIVAPTAPAPGVASAPADPPTPEETPAPASAAPPGPPVSSLPLSLPPTAAPDARPAPSPANASTPTVAELPAAERRQLPAMKLSMHMWNEQPAQRFVILDGIRYGEGDRIGAAVITGIDTGGIVLELNGRAVRLPLR
jgi:general secretion pathway protein B